MSSPVPTTWGSRFINAEGVEWNMSADPDAVAVQGRTGDFGVLPFEPQLAESPTGGEAAVSGVRFSRGILTIPIKMKAPAGGYLRDTLDTIRNILRAEIDEGEANRGYLYVKRYSELATPDEWRVPAAPLPFPVVVEDPRDRERWYAVEFKFTALSRAWEIEPPTANRGTLSPGGAWQSHTVTLTPGGDVITPPIWEFDGPSSGTINTLDILNQRSAKRLTFANLGLTSGRRLIIRTGHMDKSAKIYTINGDGSTGALVEDVYYRRSESSEFWHMRPTSQTITFTKDASSTSVIRVSYRRRVGGLI